MRKSQEHAADNRAWAGALVVADRTGFVVTVRSI